MVTIAPNNTEIIIIGSGIGGLCCGAMLARYGFEVIVCESHSLAGGAAHGFEKGGFNFDSGPSLYSGLSYSPSANPLRQVLDAQLAEPVVFPAVWTSGRRDYLRRSRLHVCRLVSPQCRFRLSHRR